jgi:hypothetical protein
MAPFLAATDEANAAGAAEIAPVPPVRAAAAVVVIVTAIAGHGSRVSTIPAATSDSVRAVLVPPAADDPGLSAEF